MNNIAHLSGVPGTTRIVDLIEVTAEQIDWAALIDSHAQRYTNARLNRDDFVATLGSDMGAFKNIVDSATRVQLDYLCQQYPGVYRFGKLLASLSQDVSTGAVNAPETH